MKSLRRHLICTAAFAIAAATGSMAQAQVSANKIPTFVYEGAGCDGAKKIAQFESLIGRPVDGAADFMDFTSTYPNLLNSVNWALNCWKGKVKNLSLGVPMVVNQNDGSPLHELAQGQFDTYYTQIAQALVSHGFGNAYLRIGWEFNGGWYNWYAGSSPTVWMQGYEEIVKTMRAVPGANFKFVWNPSIYQQGIEPYKVYPGDSYVDVIAQDTYNVSWVSGYKNPAVMWDSVDNSAWGLAAIVKFAKQHNKPLAFPEWGTGTRSDGHGGGDDPMFLTNVAAVMAANKVAYHSYWDYYAADYNSDFSDAKYNVKAAIAFMNYYGDAGAGSTSKSVILKNAGVILKPNSSAYTPAPLAVTCTGCSSQVLQNGPGHYSVILWSTTAVQAATLSWSGKTINANVYNPSVGTTPVMPIGATSSVTLPLTPGQPLLVNIQR